MSENIYDSLCGICGTGQVLRDEPMREHTTFRIGGPADYLVSPADEESLLGILAFCKKEGIPCYVCGNGSNLLVGDGGFRGVMIRLGKDFGTIRVEGTKIYAQAGALLSKVARMASQESLTGLEFAAGIPGTVGGAMIMNAGAYGGEMKDVVTSVRVLTGDDEVRTVTGEEMEFGYRASRAAREGWIVLAAEMVLQKGEISSIEAKMEELRSRRVEKQPLELPSAGSTFKRPEGYFAGKLIMDSGLRGYTAGGAQISPKHCGFVVNIGNATAADVCAVMEHAIRTVQEKYGVTLEQEVKRVGEFL